MRLVCALLVWLTLPPGSEPARGDSAPGFTRPQPSAASTVLTLEIHVSAGLPASADPSCERLESALEPEEEEEEDRDDVGDPFVTVSPSSVLLDLARESTQVARRLWSQPHPAQRSAILLC